MFIIPPILYILVMPDDTKFRRLWTSVSFGPATNSSDNLLKNINKLVKKRALAKRTIIDPSGLCEK